MRNNHPVILSGILLLAVVVMMSSCYTEQSLGRRFVTGTMNEKPSVWFIGANHLYKTCTMEEDSVITPCVFTGAAMEDSLLELYNAGFARQLEGYGYRVFSYYESDSFFSQAGLKLIVNIVQLELEEQTSYERESEVFDEMEYVEMIPVRLVSLNSWVEISVVDSATARQDLFYTSDSIMDVVDGYFLQHQISGNVTYYFRRYAMKPLLMPRLAGSSGQKHAMRLFDVWMNRYIEKHDPVSVSQGYQYPSRIYYHYDPERKRVIPADASGRMQKL
ncbi:MAG TPA: hypothetical protein P5228_10565 [Bacteroidales bacterium]|nr:hypothetical protein [Bacteroidales bacterium]HRZ49361.1 hypothetical protein [Bacteroidales bacterium]